MLQSNGLWRLLAYFSDTR